MLVQVHKHVLFERSLSVVDADGVVVAIQTVDKGLDRGFVQMANVRCGLAGLVTHHESLRVDQAEGVNDNLALDGLYRIDDYGNGAGSELFERLLRVDVDRGKPAAETGMRVVPAYNRLLPTACQCTAQIKST